MSSLPAYWGILMFLACLGLILTLVSGITLGRKMGDYSYQKAMNINGITRTQTWVTIRTHANRVQLGIFLLLIGILPLSPVVYEVRAGLSIAGLCWVALTYAVSSVLDWRDDDRIMNLQIQKSRSREEVQNAHALELRTLQEDE